MTQPKPQPQRCAVGSCGREPTQIEYYETTPEATDDYKGAAGTPVCAGHTGMAKEGWRLSGVEPIPGRPHYASTAPQ